MSVETKEALCVWIGLSAGCLLVLYGLIRLWLVGHGSAPAGEAARQSLTRLKEDLWAAVPLLIAGEVALILLRRAYPSGRGMAAGFAVGALLALVQRVLDHRAVLRSAGSFQTAPDEPALDGAVSRSVFLGALPIGLVLLGFAALNFVQARNMGTVLYGFAAAAVIVAVIAEFGRSPAAGTRNLALFAVLLAAAMSLGMHHFTKSRLGLLFPLLFCGVCAVPSLVGTGFVAAYLRPTWRSASVFRLLGTAFLVLVFLLIVGKWQFLGDAKYFHPIWLGLVIGLVLREIGRWNAAVGGERALAPQAVGAAALLLGLGIAISFGRTAGFGVGLFGLGLWAFAAGIAGSDQAAQAFFGYRAEPADDRAGLAVSGLQGGARVAQLAGAAIALFLLARGLSEEQGWRGLDVVPRDAWLFFGLMLGLAWPFLVAGIARSSTDGERALPGAACSRAWLTVLMLLAPCAAAFFWRADTLSGVAVGLALAVFVALCADLFGSQVLVMAATLGALLVSLVTWRFVPLIHEATGGEGRLARILIVIGIAVGAALISVLLSFWGRQGAAPAQTAEQPDAGTA